jgi:hypothetical protein
MGTLTRAQKVVLSLGLVALLITAAAATAMFMAPRRPAVAISVETPSAKQALTTESPQPTAQPSVAVRPTTTSSTKASPPATYRLPPVTQSSEPVLAPAPPAPPAQRAPAPPPRVICPAGKVQPSLTSVSFSSYEYDKDKSVITVKGAVTNNTTGVVTLNDNDVPNFKGLNTRGEAVVIELYGKWDWSPPAGKPRPTHIAMQPGERLAYTVTSTSNNATINEVKFWFSDGQLGSMEASFDFDGPYWDCPDPLPSNGEGDSMPATNLPPVK